MRAYELNSCSGVDTARRGVSATWSSISQAKLSPCHHRDERHCSDPRRASKFLKKGKELRSSINLRQAYPPCPADQVPDLRLEFVAGFWREAQTHGVMMERDAALRRGLGLRKSRLWSTRGL